MQFIETLQHAGNPIDVQLTPRRSQASKDTLVDST
jgi:hypothetical protein